jgi:predicted Zn finger-like uncharacterized protein
MQVACEKCGAKYNLSDTQIAQHSRVQFRCPKCTHTTVIDVATRPESTQAVSPLPSFARGGGGGGAGLPEMGGTIVSSTSGLSLPTDKNITVSVIGGQSKGLSHPLSKPRVVIGRRGGGADIEIDDQEVSRWHCAIEVKQDVVKLRDLDSTNGTFMEDERVRAAELQHLSEFRVGSTVLLVTITPKQD